jgi:hypothetical protein
MNTHAAALAAYRMLLALPLGHEVRLANQQLMSDLCEAVAESAGVTPEALHAVECSRMLALEPLISPPAALPWMPTSRFLEFEPQRHDAYAFEASLEPR